MEAVVTQNIIPVVFDTEATISVMSERFFERLNIPLKERVVKLNSINSSFECLGLASVKVIIVFIALEIELFVISLCAYEIILGLDYLSQFNLRLGENHRVTQELVHEGEFISHDMNLIPFEEYNRTNMLLQDDRGTELDEIIPNFSPVFSLHEYDIGLINIEQCCIALTSEIPITLRPYRCSEKDQGILEEQIKLLLEHGLIRKSISPYSFPVTLVNKKDEGEKTRLCVDFRKLNKIAVADNFSFS